MPAIALASLLFAAAAPSAADRATLDAAVAAIYQPYRTSNSPPDWERPIYSAEIQTLIARWRRVTPSDEVDGLSDADWLCMCQDWDEHKFRATIRSRQFPATAAAIVGVHVDVGFSGGANDARLFFKRENGRWKLDDIYAGQFFPRGLKMTLRETIAEDSKR
jgi:hypothetical protein